MPYARRYRRRAPPRRTRTTRTARANHPPRYNRRVPLRNKARWQGVGTKVMWFRTATDLTSSGAGVLNDQNKADDVRTDSAQFATIAPLWKEYKVVKVVQKWIPSDIGSESATFARGNAVTYVDATMDRSSPSSIASIIERPSTRLINTRRTQVRYMFRPSGLPAWGDSQDPATTPDPWQSGQISLYVESATASVNLWYSVTSFKVVFRGRYD